MPSINAFTLLLNGLTISLALGFLIIILWHEAQKLLHQLFAVFLAFVVIWNIGSLLVQAAIVTQISTDLLVIANSFAELGFAGSSIVIYILATVLVGAHTPQFRVLALLSVLVVLIYRFFLIANEQSVTQSIVASSIQYHTVTVGFYILFGLSTLYITWHYRRRLRSNTILIGILTFIFGQSISFVNTELAISALSTSLSAIGALLISFSILHQEVIRPLKERNSQLETMHQVSLAITSQTAINKLLNEIAVQAAGWLEADGVGIFLANEKHLDLANVYQLPPELLHSRIEYGQGVAGTVAVIQETIHLENYTRDWTDNDEFASISSSFGSMICVPLLYGGEIIGVLSVVSGRQGRLFNTQDVRLLELLAAQAAVAIAHSKLYADQKSLAEQLHTVLTSTENPVIAVDRNLHLIFSNPSAKLLFDIPENSNQKSIETWLPKDVFPTKPHEVVASIRQGKAYTYEIMLNNHVFLCHLATLGSPRIVGWVAVLNDVTELKELDRLKSEMVRMASHDLKNPLMGAMAFLELLIDELRDSEQQLNKSEMISNATSIEHQLERMNRIIRGVLDIERLRSLTELNDLCDTKSIVEYAIDELKFQFADANVNLDVQIQSNLPRFWGNQNQFTRAIVNLIENALKFSIHGKKEIRISAYLENAKICISISDNGVGIPSDLHEKIFDRFYRAKQSDVTHVTGSGLGLNLVKSIVDHHNGNIRLESQEGIGTTFFIELPSAT